MSYHSSPAVNLSWYNLLFFALPNRQKTSMHKYIYVFCFLILFKDRKVDAALQEQSKYVASLCTKQNEVDTLKQLLQNSQGTNDAMKVKCHNNQQLMYSLVCSSFSMNIEILEKMSY